MDWSTVLEKCLCLEVGNVFDQQDLLDEKLRTTALTGPTAGATFEVPLNKNGFDFSELIIHTGHPIRFKDLIV